MRALWQSCQKIPVGQILVLSAICFYGYWNGLSCYFLADDTIPLSDLTSGVQGHPELILRRLISPWLMDKNFLSFYRPIAELSLALDCLLWRGNPFGYHLTNLLAHLAATLLLFLLTKRLLCEYSRKDASLVALIASALFAASPLHGEAVVWIMGRIDVIFTAFYLASFLLFIKALQDNSRASLWASVAACAGSLFTKEAGLSLPVVLTWYCLVTKPTGDSWRAAALRAVRKVLPFWIAAGLYLAVRSLVIGTLVGGYVGSGGEYFSRSVLERCFSPGWLPEIFFPFKDSLFAFHNPTVQALLSNALAVLYLSAGLLLLFRIAWSPWDSRLIRSIVLVSGWLLITIMVAAPAWRVDSDLADTRVLYLLTAPLYLLSTLILLPVGLSDRQPRSTRERILGHSCTAVLSGVTALFIVIGRLDNLAWLEASDQMCALQAAIAQTEERLAPGRKLVILNLPRVLHGVHMLYFYEMLKGLLRPPLCRQDLSNRVATLEPVFFGSEDLVNRSRLRRMNDDPERYAFFSWDVKSKKLLPLTELFPKVEPTEKVDLTVRRVPSLSDSRAEQYSISVKQAVRTAAVDIVELDLISHPTVEHEAAAPQAPARMLLCWEGRPGAWLNVDRGAVARLITDGNLHTYRFFVGQRIGWLLAGWVNLLSLNFSPGCRNDILSVRFINGERVIPTLSPEMVEEGLDGICRPKTDSAGFSYDASKIPGARSVLVEISKPRSYFLHYTSTLRDNALCKHSLSTISLSALKGTFQLPMSTIPIGDRFQVRIAALSSGGRVLGTVSDPVTIEIPRSAANR